MNEKSARIKRILQLAALYNDDNDITIPANHPSCSKDLETIDQISPTSQASDEDKIIFSSDSDEDPTFFPTEVLSSESSDVDTDVGNSINIKDNLKNHYSYVKVIVKDILENVFKQCRTGKRWKKANPMEWKREIAKKMRKNGEEYITNKKLRLAKCPKSVNCHACRFKCSKIFNEDDRLSICRAYWCMEFLGRKNFILSNVKVEPVKTRCLIRSSQKKAKSYSKKCYLTKNNEKHQVCQKFFTATLSISPDVIEDAIKKATDSGTYSSEDRRGRKEPGNKIKLEDIQLVKDHILSFPTMESHYCRKESKRQYLSSNLNIKKMFNLYKEFCDAKGYQAVSHFKYRSIFSENYNFSFFKPKKDQCVLCTNYDGADENTKSKLQEKYDEHLRRNQICQKAKQTDKERAANEDDFMSVTFDLQAVLQVPSGKVSQLYYSRKLVVYNFTVYEAPSPNNAFCLFWNEINGKKGSCEIGTCILYYLKECLPSTIKHVTLFSDTCGGQNRNQFIAALLIWAVQSIANLQIIEQKFLESGHTYMEVDSMHSSIETASKNLSINSVNDWLNVFKSARKRRPYNVKEFKYNEFLDLKNLTERIMKNRTKDNEDEKVKWLLIKRIKYVKGEKNKIYFNYDMSDNFKVLRIFEESTSQCLSPTTVQTRSNKRKPTFGANIISHPREFPDTLDKVYKSSLPISAKKKSDLLTLCKKNIIPEEYHAWFADLKTSSTIVDRIPDVDINENSGAEEEI